MICFFQGRALSVLINTSRRRCTERVVQGSTVTNSILKWMKKNHQMPHESHCLKGYISIKTGFKNILKGLMGQPWKDWHVTSFLSLPPLLFLKKMRVSEWWVRAQTDSCLSYLKFYRYLIKKMNLGCNFSPISVPGPPPLWFSFLMCNNIWDNNSLLPPGCMSD